MTTRFPAIEVIRKSGKEYFQGIEVERTLKDFWAWAFSDLVSNTERGKLAEYIVATAMGCDEGTSPTWGSFDLLSPEGIKIEVKASAYIQSWEQKSFSRIEFSIAESLYWDGVAYAKEKKRQAAVKGQKTICLARVAELCGKGPCTYQMLKGAVMECGKGGPHDAYEK